MRITHEQIDEIVDAFAECQIDENSPTLKFNVESLQENFNAQINPLLEKTFELGELDAESLALLKHLLLIDEYQIHSADDMEFFFNIFGDTIGLFGIKKRDENFKILFNGKIEDVNIFKQFGIGKCGYQFFARRTRSQIPIEIII